MNDTGWVKFKDAPFILLQNLYDGADIMDPGEGGIERVLKWIESGEAKFFNERYFPEPYRSDPRYRRDSNGRDKET
jgi:hypothetical protein